MPVRELSGTDLIALDAGNVLDSVAAGPFTLLCLTHLASTADRATMFSLQNGTTDEVASFGSDGVNMFARCGGAETYQYVSVSSAAWIMLGVTKGAGTSAARLHCGGLNTDGSGWGGWHHDNGALGGLLPISAVECTRIVLGASEIGSDTFRAGRYALFAVFDRVVSDAELESFVSAAGVQAASPLMLVQLNQASIGTALVDLMGNGADQVAISGTTVVTTDNPPGFPLTATALAPTRPVVAKHSGGTGNTNGAADLGGAEGGKLSVASNSLFGTPSNVQRLAGFTDYRCIYLRNVSTSTATDLRAWISTPTPATDVSEAIGEDISNPAQVIASATAAPPSVSFSQPANYTAGLTLGNLTSGGVIPIWIRRNIAPDAAGGFKSFTIAFQWTEASAPSTQSITYEIIEPVTLYVNADSSTRSDTRTREEAGDDPALPFATMQAAALVAGPGDTIQVEPSTLGNADPTNSIDPDVYYGIHHMSSSDGSDILPMADNSGNEAINVVGHIVGDVYPKFLHLDLLSVQNWSFSHFQKGYDRGSGDDNNTSSFLHICADLTFTDIIFTGGAFKCIGALEGLLHWDHCTIYSPYIVGNNQEMNGAGFHCLGYDTSTGLAFDCDWLWSNCHFEDVHGEDCIQISSTIGEIVIRECEFIGIDLPNIPNPPHTDCIQPIRVASLKVIGNRFINCFQPMLASDGENGRISVIGNISSFGQNGLWGQGMAEFIAVHNTIRNTYGGFSVGSRANETNPGFVQKLTIVNNVCNYLDIQGGTVIDPASIVTNNVCYGDPGQVTPWGTQVAGIPEFGTSPRTIASGLPGLELSNSPTPSAGIGGGRALTGLGLQADELAYLANDYLTRPYATPRDAGALQSDPITLVTPGPRSPYVQNTAPHGTAAQDISITARLVPVPGQTINPATAISANAYVYDSATNTILPSVITVGALDGSGGQLLTIDLKSMLSPVRDGRLWPRVLYVVVLDGIEDTAGSAIVPVSWEFRAGGPVGAAISPQEITVGWNVGTI